MSLEFKPTIKSINIASEDLTKITLEIKNNSLNGKYDELRKLSGKTVNIQIIPEYYSYSVPFDKSTNAPMQEYVVNNDGTIDFVKKEQTQLEIDDQGNIDIEDRDFLVTKEIIDEFIRAARSLEFPGNINPRDVLIRLGEGESVEDIAESYEMSEISLLNGLENARVYYAPYAAAWDKKRNEVIFQDVATEVEENSEIYQQEGKSDALEEDSSKSLGKEENVSEGKIEGENEIVGIDEEADGDLFGQSDPYGNEPPEDATEFEEKADDDDEPY